MLESAVREIGSIIGRMRLGSTRRRALPIMFGMASGRTEVDRIRAQLEAEPVFVAEGVELTLAGLRELRGRIERRQLEVSDRRVLAAVVRAFIAEAEADEREISTIALDDAGEDRGGSIVDHESMHEVERWASEAEASAPSGVARGTPSGEARRG